MPLLNVSNLLKRYPDESGDLRPVVDLASFSMEAGEQVALKGPSGCGKTTFLHLLAGILPADGGVIEVAGQDLGAMGEARRDRFRAETVGYVFQSFHLMRDFTCMENVELGMAFGAKVDPVFAEGLLRRVGLGHRLDYRASALSVGQQQRVALARALANRPRMVLADEPTGSLDERSAAGALELMRELCRENGSALLLASHDTRVMQGFERVDDFEELNAASHANAGGAQ